MRWPTAAGCPTRSDASGPSADRGRVGESRARRRRRPAVSMGQRHRSVARQLPDRPVGQTAARHASNRHLPAQRVRSVRHVRQRLGMGQRLVHRRLLRIPARYAIRAVQGPATCASSAAGRGSTTTCRCCGARTATRCRPTPMRTVWGSESYARPDPQRSASRRRRQRRNRPLSRRSSSRPDEAVVRRAPDVAFVTVTVETRAKNPRDAQRLNAEAMTAVSAGRTQLAYSERRVQTRLRSRQEFDFANGRRVSREFVARNASKCAIDEIATTGEIARRRWSQPARRRSAAFASTCRIARCRARGAAPRGRGRAARAEAMAAGAGRSLDRILKIEEARDAAIRRCPSDDHGRRVPRRCNAGRSRADRDPRGGVTLTASMK